MKAVLEFISCVFLFLFAIFALPYFIFDKHLRRRCPLHKRRMELDENCPLVFGQVTPKDQELEKKYFPYSRSYMCGGSLRSNSPNVTKVRFCPDCRQAEKKYGKKSRRG